MQTLAKEKLLTIDNWNVRAFAILTEIVNAVAIVIHFAIDSAIAIAIDVLVASEVAISIDERLRLRLLLLTMPLLRVILRLRY